MKKLDIVKAVLKEKHARMPEKPWGKAFAPTNIALCKYWGKRNSELNLPVTSSLSISLGNKGTTTEVKESPVEQDQIFLGNEVIQPASPFGRKLIDFLDLFRPQKPLYFHVNTFNNIPTAAGLASSASGFAALVMALNEFFNWNLNTYELSILARLGSGSACRSIWQGFVEWEVGKREDGMDSHGKEIDAIWPDLCIGLLIMSVKEKRISSREAMLRTVNTSPFYALWPNKVEKDIEEIKQAIHKQDIDWLGKIAESDAMAMHALMLSAWPPVSYALSETVIAMQKIWEIRDQGLQFYFTQDAGPNLKLLFLKKDLNHVLSVFPQLELIQPFIGKDS